MLNVRRATLVSVLLMLVLTACEVLLEDSPASTNTNGDANSWYRLYFTDPATTAQMSPPSGGIPDEIIATLDTAQKTIDLAVYEFNWMPLAEALVRAAERGVTVRVATDSDSMNEETIAELQNANIPVAEDSRSAIMHHKFVVIDGALVWTGSMNFSINDAYKNNNSYMLIASTKLAENYTAKFEQMYTDGLFGETFYAPNPSFNLSGTDIENYFSPDSDVAAQILEELQAAQTSIYFLAFSFTRDDFSQVLIDKAGAGVTVQGVFEARQISAGADAAWNTLTGAGLDVKQDGNPRTMHHKVFIIDGQTVVMGSYNFSKAAEESNDENILILHNPDIAAAYFQEWESVWAQAKP